MPEKFCGQRSLVGYNPWGHKESDMIEWLNMHAKCHLLYIYPLPGFKICNLMAFVRFGKILSPNCFKYCSILLFLYFWHSNYMCVRFCSSYLIYLLCSFLYFLFPSTLISVLQSGWIFFLLAEAIFWSSLTMFCNV